MGSTTPSTGRLIIPPGAIDPQTSITIPLQVIRISEAGAYKVGIQVALSTPGSSAAGEPFLYEFDTGGKGFFASAAHVPAPAQTLGAVSDTYQSGNQFSGQAAVVNVSFPASSADRSFPVLIGLIDTFSTKSGPATFPQDDHGFYGDFGASLEATPVQSTNAVSLLTVLAQLGEPFNSGFIVDVGPYPGGGQGQGQLIVGVTDTLRELFPNALQMRTSTPYTPAGQTAAPVATYQAALITGTLTVGSAGSAGDIDVVLDTGAPHTTFHPGSTLTAAFTPRPGDDVTLTSNGVTILQFQQGNTLGIDKAKVETAATNGAGTVNTGLAPFFANPILFDLETGTIRFASPA